MVKQYSIQSFKSNDYDHESAEIAAPNKRTIGLMDMCGVILLPIVANSHFRKDTSDVKWIEHKATLLNDQWIYRATLYENLSLCASLWFEYFVPDHKSILYPTRTKGSFPYPVSILGIIPYPVSFFANPEMSEISINTVENINEIDQTILLTTCTKKLHRYYRVALHSLDFHRKFFS